MNKIFVFGAFRRAPSYLNRDWHLASSCGWLVRGLTCATAAILPTFAHGAFANYNSVLIGERAAGMGGAFTALTGDPAATAFYNPATTVLLQGTSVSASANVYNKYDTNIGGGQDFSGAPMRVNRGFFRSIPASSGTVVNFGSFAAGFSIVVPDYDFFSGQIHGAQNTSSFLSAIDESLWVGGTLSGKLTEADSIGLTYYYTARNLSRTVNDKVTTATSAVITQEEKNLTTNSLVAVAGYHRRLSDTWSVGFSYRFPSLPIAGEASYFRSVTRTSPYSNEVINRGNLRALTRIPAKISLGVAREIKGANTISFDLQFYESLGYRDLPELPEGAELVSYRQVTNIAVGYEQVVNNWVTLRLGYFSNFGAHSTPDLAHAERQGDHVDMQGFSANLAFGTKDNTSFTFGGYYSGGSGETLQLSGEKLSLLPKEQQIFTMLVATGFRF
jgi:long-chain fatty acid transport protein